MTILCRIKVTILPLLTEARGSAAKSLERKMIRTKIETEMQMKLTSLPITVMITRKNSFKKWFIIHAETEDFRVKQNTAAVTTSTVTTILYCRQATQN